MRLRTLHTRIYIQIFYRVTIKRLSNELKTKTVLIVLFIKHINTY